MHDVTEIKAIIEGHFQRMEEVRHTHREIREACSDRLWSRLGPFGDRGSILRVANTEQMPVRVQVNTVRPFLEREKASLYRHQPRVVVKRPTIRSSQSRRDWREDDAKALSEFGTAFLQQEWMRRVFEDALEQGIMTPGCALKIGWDAEKKGSPLSRLWVQAVQRWDVGWDERVRDVQQQRYRFHLRWERLDRAAALCPDLRNRTIERTSAVRDYLVDGVSAEPGDGVGEGRARGYVQLVEWWDLEAEEVQVFVVDGTSVDACGSKPEKLRYRYPDGSPIIQIIPVVLQNVVGQPMEATTAVMPAFHESCEKSLMATYVVNAMRRSLSRVAMYDKSIPGLKDDIKRLAVAGDLEFIGLEGAVPKDAVHILEWPDVSPMLDKAYRYMGLLAAESSSQSSLGRGQTTGIEYASATAAQALAQGDAAAKALPAERMAGYMAEVVRCAFGILATERVGLAIDVGSEAVTLSPRKLAQEWEIRIEGTAAQATRQAEQRVALLQALPLYQGAVAAAATPSMPPGPDGKREEIPDAIRVAAQHVVDLLVGAFELPEHMRWRGIVDAEADIDDEDEESEEEDPRLAMAATMVPEAPPAPAMPVEPAAAPPGLSDDPEVAALAAAYTDEELAAMQAALEG